MRTKDVVDHFGSVQKVADVLGIFRSAIYQWGEDVPPRRALEIEKLTRGKLKAPPVVSAELSDSRVA